MCVMRVCVGGSVDVSAGVGLGLSVSVSVSVMCVWVDVCDACVGGCV